jgi:hypothetical protein
VERVVIAVALAAVVFVAAWVLQRRRPEPPSQGQWAVPAQLDRGDFDSPEAPWLIAVFSSATCNSCAEAVDKATLLSGPDVAVQEVEAVSSADLHRRYNIDAVPMVVVADSEGVVRASFVGPPPAAELWALVAQLREAG